MNTLSQQHSTENEEVSTLIPECDFSSMGVITMEDLQEDAEQHLAPAEPVEHHRIFKILLEKLDTLNFRKEAELKSDEKLGKKHFVIICILAILRVAKENNCDICKINESVFIYNGVYWKPIEVDDMQRFLSEAAQKMGVNFIDAKYHSFVDELKKQFVCEATQMKSEVKPGLVLINLINGTYEIKPEHQRLRPHAASDRITHLLPFEYNPEATAPKFQAYLDKVIPEKEKQLIIAEYLGYLFIPTSTLKLEKVLLLYGTGANGKSVFFEIVQALIGKENITNFSLQMLTDVERGGPYRAKIDTKLLNYASEINGKLETSIFKAMVSGEPLEAKALYGQPFQITNYAKLIFNCNELPRDVEQTHAFFRRFLIIPFDVTIPENEQDRELSKNIIATELSGVFNWVMSGLTRLMSQGQFTYSDLAKRQVDLYKKQSDSIQMFIEEDEYVKSAELSIELQDFYNSYKRYCSDSGCHPVAKKKMSERLRNIDFRVDRKASGYVVYAQKANDPRSDQFKV